jgi:hypothetical protein
VGSFRFDYENTPIIEVLFRFVSISLPLLGRDSVREWYSGNATKKNSGPVPYGPGSVCGVAPPEGFSRICGAICNWKC